ncbi:DUF3099 domain-containing protein [Cellulomonas marina]|uniref:DUF3099 domain-containing protein n=1 Tax=Cellulomonas marina TaxID=988821 RepID=A0A1I0ZSC5_9CELL|nr:DUF3099 domain-containing protein [Cellulomonas marina]GIG28803.1 hypothetical protein Cma02nite_14030 [Cellulomonas marina]SFB28401.1 Protein of unknown function [Cellulomonas marina]
MTKRERPDEAVQSITSAPEPLWEDVARRQRRYLWQMSLRAVCFVVAAVTWNVVPVWASLLMIVAATVLPYFAVLLANAGRENPGQGPTAVDRPAIAAAPAPTRVLEGGW